MFAGVGLIPPNDLKGLKCPRRNWTDKVINMWLPYHCHANVLKSWVCTVKQEVLTTLLPLLKLHFRWHFNSIFGQKLRRLFFELFAKLFSCHKRFGRHMLNKARGWGQSGFSLKIENKIRWWRYEGAMIELISASNITNWKKVHTIGVLQSIQLQHCQQDKPLTTYNKMNIHTNSKMNELSVHYWLLHHTKLCICDSGTPIIVLPAQLYIPTIVGLL